MFSLPVLFTMEIWEIALVLSSARLLCILALTLLLLLGYNTYAGVRPNETWAGVVIDSVEELGLALIVSGAALALLGRIRLTDPIGEIVAKIVLEAMLVAIGISVGTAQMTQQSSEDDETPGRRPKDILGVIVVATCGAIVFATNIAVTEEVQILALEASSGLLLAVMVVSILLAATVIVFSNLLERDNEGVEWDPKRSLIGALLAYAVALLCSGLTLSLLGRFDGVALQPCLAMTILLGLASSVGAASGKLLVK